MSARRWFVFAALLILADQASKLAVRATFTLGERLPLTGFFNLTLVYNPGAAFSFLSDAGGWQRIFFSLLAAGIALWIAWAIRREPAARLRNSALALILGGAIGNLIDRLAYGAVVDFLDLHLGGWHWPAFNLADSGICVGAAILVWAEIRTPRPHPAPRQP